MSLIFAIKRGTTARALRLQLPGGVSLAGAIARFQMRLPGGPTVLDAPAQLIEEGDPEEGIAPVLGYQWQPGDTDVTGRYDAEFDVTYPTGRIESFPDPGFIRVMVGDSVEDMP